MADLPQHVGGVGQEPLQAIDIFVDDRRERATDSVQGVAREQPRGRGLHRGERRLKVVRQGIEHGGSQLAALARRIHFRGRLVGAGPLAREWGREYFRCRRCRRRAERRSKGRRGAVRGVVAVRRDRRRGRAAGETERLRRYVSRPPVAVERLDLTAQGQRYRLKTPYRDGTTQIVLEPLDFIARLAALVPPPRMHLTRFHGVFAAHGVRAAITPAGRGTGAGKRAAAPQPEATRMN